MHLLRIFEIKSMKMRLWRIANYETMQYMKKRRYPQQSDIQTLSTYRFFMLETPAKSFKKSRNYAPFKNFQDQKYENATMAHC